ncbi:MAG TPA: carboxypeptidase M32 [Anaerolineaceae bacterium]|jgi:carboxypeptidase Taq|nr:carboxypeptidase M32 [Anaerolineaceae bacterium]HQF63102.1 carboxypeptidase M32 [Anaerolineaceae bacterium]HQH86088.1 carboxypeptidase M32 [Anaerolineaceae bacterium]
MTKIEQLEALTRELGAIQRASAVLGWDAQVNMPAGGAEERGFQLGVLAELSHKRFVNDETHNLIVAAEAEAASLDPDSIQARLVKYCRRDYDKATRVPAAKVAEFAQVTAVSQEAWARARSENNFAAFLPHLERVIELRREYASYFAPYDHVYDPLLDDFERGMKTAEVQAIFNQLRPVQVELVHAIAARPEIENSFLYQNYPEQAQWDFGVEVATRMGYDWNRGRQDKSAHPFTTSFGLGDVRITTRFDTGYVGSALFSTMHEGGHALYEQGFDPALRGLPLADGASMAVHESQSRLWENLVGRSLAFWKFFYPRLKEYFPTQLANVDLQTFYRGINKVKPSYIRVESDEATYNLHIMLRLELEIALMEGSLKPADLPAAWNARFQEYLGLTPPTDKVGVLQDVHWSHGLIGYFPTYALGNLVSCQLWEVLQQAIPDLESQIEHGELGVLLAWLRQNVHTHGSMFEPQELVQKITGSRIDPQPYMRYLKTKFGQIYGL